MNTGTRPNNKKLTLVTHHGKGNWNVTTMRFYCNNKIILLNIFFFDQDFFFDQEFPATFLEACLYAFNGYFIPRLRYPIYKILFGGILKVS